jgi:hypothetical protein
VSLGSNMIEDDIIIYIGTMERCGKHFERSPLLFDFFNFFFFLSLWENSRDI